MRGRAGLPGELRFRELQRFNFPQPLWIDGWRFPIRAAASIRLALLHLLLDSCFRVDQAFSGISHLLRIQETRGRAPTIITVAKRADVLELFHPSVAEWFRASFAAPTPPQAQGWPAIARGESTLILAPTGSGKTLAAFLWAINRVMFGGDGGSVRILYISPLKALAVDVERNL